MQTYHCPLYVLWQRDAQRLGAWKGHPIQLLESRGL